MIRVDNFCCSSPKYISRIKGTVNAKDGVFSMTWQIFQRPWAVCFSCTIRPEFRIMPLSKLDKFCNCFRHMKKYRTEVSLKEKYPFIYNFWWCQYRNRFLWHVYCFMLKVGCVHDSWKGNTRNAIYTICCSSLVFTIAEAIQFLSGTKVKVNVFLSRSQCTFGFSVSHSFKQSVITNPKFSQ